MECCNKGFFVFFFGFDGGFDRVDEGCQAFMRPGA